MKTPFLRALRVAVPFSTVALLATVAFAPTASAEEWTKTYSVSGRANVHLDTNDGSVRVTTSDTKQVELLASFSNHLEFLPRKDFARWIDGSADDDGAQRERRAIL